jgi:hypothetical protein
MGEVLSFNSVRNARGQTLSSTRTCRDMADECAEEIRVKLSVWVAELSAAISHLEKMSGVLNAKIDLLPVSESKVDLENQQAKIVIGIYRARRFLAEL